MTPEGASTPYAHVYTTPDGEFGLGFQLEDGGKYYVLMGDRDPRAAQVADSLTGEPADFLSPITPAEQLGRNPITEVFDTSVSMALPALSAEGSVQPFMSVLPVVQAVGQSIASSLPSRMESQSEIGKAGSILPFVATATTQFNFSMNASSGYPDENKLSFSGKVDHPGEWESLIPIWGSGKEAIAYFQEGDYGAAAFYTVMAVSDAFLIKSIGSGVLPRSFQIRRAFLDRHS